MPTTTKQRGTKKGTTNRVGRPPTGQTPSITFRGPRERYERAAAAAGLTLSQWLRRAADAAAECNSR